MTENEAKAIARARNAEGSKGGFWSRQEMKAATQQAAQNPADPKNAILLLVTSKDPNDPGQPFINPSNLRMAIQTLEKHKLDAIDIICHSIPSTHLDGVFYNWGWDLECLDSLKAYPIENVTNGLINSIQAKRWQIAIWLAHHYPTHARNLPKKIKTQAPGIEEISALIQNPEKHSQQIALWDGAVSEPTMTQPFAPWGINHKQIQTIIKNAPNRFKKPDDPIIVQVFHTSIKIDAIGIWRIRKKSPDFIWVNDHTVTPFNVGRHQPHSTTEAWVRSRGITCIDKRTPTTCTAYTNHTWLAIQEHNDNRDERLWEYCQFTLTVQRHAALAWASQIAQTWDNPTKAARLKKTLCAGFHDWLGILTTTQKIRHIKENLLPIGYEPDARETAKLL